MNTEVYGSDVSKALRDLADAIDNGKALNARAVTELEFADIVQQTPLGAVSFGKTPTGNVVLTVHFTPNDR